jgi:polyisoprenoid-binding protein YceI
MPKASWRAWGPVAAALLAGFAAPAAAADRLEVYQIDQRFGDISFAVRNLGLFATRGEFRRFAGELAIDEAHPEQTRIAVTIDCRSVDMSWAEAASMLRSPPYLDIADHPESRFTSTKVVSTAPDRFTIEGVLQLRGVSRPVVLAAALLGRHKAPEPGAEIAEFAVTGKLRRSEFGMTADRLFVSDQVELQIHARVRLEESGGGG